MSTTKTKKIFFRVLRGSQFDIIINNRSLRIGVFNMIPRHLMDKILLTFPFLYKTKIVNFETAMSLQNGIHELLEKIEEIRDVEGDIIECGSARCGTTVIMGKYLQKNKISKTIYTCDSFEGFDKEELKSEREKRV